MYELSYLIVLFAAISVISGQGISEFPTFLINGKTAPINKYPYLVSIRVGGAHNCGGSIINKRWILTAAHCASDEFDIELLTVVAGSVTLDGDGDEYGLEEKIPHKNWDSRLNINDIALLKVDRDIDFRKKQVEPIDLAFPHEVIPDDAPIEIAGWGYTRYPSSQASNILLFINVTVVPNKKCLSIWSSETVITDNHLCAQDPDRNSGTCLGDSGGPYVYKNKQVGVHIFGDWCKLYKPGVATRVSEYLEWIEEQQSLFP